MIARAVVALASLAVVIGCRERRDGGTSEAATTAATVAPAAAARVLYPSAPGSFVELVEGARHGVVAIRALEPVKSGPAAMFPGAPVSAADVALGTGFLIHTKGVYVLTTERIASAADPLEVVLADGTAHRANVVGRDARLNIALLSIDVPRLHALRLGDSDKLVVGEWLVVLGNPFGDEVTASAGIVSATGRPAAGSLLQGSAMSHRMFLQTDARIHRGNSGGPVLDTAGQVIGMAIASDDRASELSFVIPINRARDAFDALRETGQVARSWLGSWVKPVTAELATSLGLPKPRGALVTGVTAASPAARAGLRQGDVILTWADREVDDKSLPWIVAQTPVGRPTQVVLWRNRAEVPVAIVTERMPE